MRLSHRLGAVTLWHVHTPTPDGPGPRRAIAMLVGAGMSSQVGAAAGASAFDAIGPIGVVAIRQLVAAAALLPVARPPLRRMTAAQLRPALLLGVVFAVMNLSLYTAIDRIGLGLAVTLEFIGPLGVALAASRTRGHLLTAALAAAGVYLLVLPGPTSDVLGIGVGLLAAACWASYILLNRTIGQRLPGLQGAAVASGAAALGYLPVLVVLAASGRLQLRAVGFAVAAGVLSSLIPFAVDMTALRHVTARAFGVLMSLQPAWAALAGFALLGEALAGHEVAGIAMVVVANAATALTGPGTREALRRRVRPGRPAPQPAC